MKTRNWKSLPFACAFILSTTATHSAIFTVNSTADLPDADPADGIAATCDGSCTLRAAIMQANFTGGTNTIIVPAGIYNLTRPGVDDASLVGDLDITQPVIIQGAGPDLTIIDGNGAITGDRVIHILPTANDVTLIGLTIRDGSTATNYYTEGGGLRWEADFYGSHLRVTNVVFESNEAVLGGGAALRYYEQSPKISVVDMDHVIFRNNTATASEGGGLFALLYDNAEFDMSHSQLYGNVAGYGAGMTITSPSGVSLPFVRVETTEIFSNTAINSGGGLETVTQDTNAPMILANCHIHNNTATYGGGIDNAGTLIVDSTTVDSCSATLRGGGIFNNEGGELIMISSTLSGNTVTNGNGGAIDNLPLTVTQGSTMTITNSTIFGNSAVGGTGGGINNMSPGTVSVRNCILANNSAPSPGSGPNVSGILFSQGFNLINDTNGMTLSGTIFECIFNVSPLLGPLQNNGGLTPTHAPLAGSPVIDAGQSSGLTTDQRGFSRPYDTTLTNATFGDGADIGAVEYHPGSILVLNNNDHGAGSLRQAILDNATLGGGNTITFSNSVVGVITLTNGELAVTTPVNVFGPGATVLAVSGNHTGRVFSVLGGPAAISGLTIRDGFVVGSAGFSGLPGGDGRGGGIFNQDTLTLSNCIVRSNGVVGGVGGATTSGTGGHGGQGLGGGIYNAAGILLLQQCSFDGNSSVGGAGGGATTGNAGTGGNGLGSAVCTIAGTNNLTGCTLMNGLAMGGQGGVATSGGSSGIGGQGYGGGLYSESEVILLGSAIYSNNATAGTGGGGSGSGTGGGIYNVSGMSLTNCTIANNVASGSSADFGGGIHNNGSLAVFSCTIVGNQADFGGGLDGFVTVGNSLLASNIAGVGPNSSGTILSSDYNFIQNTAGLNLTGATNHVITGQNPLLGPLQNNGGPSFTMALLAGSPAIDQGKSFGSTIDARGMPRPYDLPAITNAAGGDGSDIGAFELVPTPTLNIRSVTNSNVLLFWSSDAAAFRLESVTNLSSANWANVSSTRITNGNQVFITNPVVGGSKFYRLNFP